MTETEKNDTGPIESYLERMGLGEVKKEDLPRGIGKRWTFAHEGVEEGHTFTIYIVYLFAEEEEGEALLRVGTKVSPASSRDQEALYRYLLQQNHWMYDTKFSLDEAGNVHLMAARNPAGLDFSEFKDMLTSVVQYYTETYESLLSFGLRFQ